MELSPPVWCFIALLAIVLILDRTFRLKLDPREPPLLSQKVPVLGHLINFLRYRSDYYLRLSKSKPSPICTLAMPNGRTYVVNNTKLVTAVQRNAKTISFDPILTIVAQRLAGINGEALPILQELETGGQGAHREMIHSMHPSLVGLGLDKMNEVMLENLEKYISAVDTSETYDLWKWTRHIISIASTDAVYGPENPYTRDNYEDGFWEYESNLTMLLVNFFPQYTASKTYQLRESLAERMIAYYRRGAWKQGSMMVRTRCQKGLDLGVPIEAIARLEVPGGTGILSNTVPTAFWTLCNILASDSLLNDIRDEAGNVFKVTTNDSGKDVYTLDAADLRSQCPKLFSVYQETMRQRACFASPRFVLEDTVIDNTYLLKKGAILQIPSAVLHHETTQWGPNAADFDPYRFTKSSSQTGIKRSQVAYRAFGGAPALCPGRHFASVEVMCFVAMTVMRYDVEPVDGQWKFPEPNYGNMAASILPPLGDIKVAFKVRKGFENKVWEYKVTGQASEEKSLFDLASG